VVRTRAAVVDAGRTLFLAQGYGGTTMTDIARAAGLTKRTVYNNYADKDALFTEIVAEVMSFADGFVAGLRVDLAGITPATLAAALHDIARRLAAAIVRPEVVALRRLLIGEAREFPALAAAYFERVPGQVLETLAVGFARLGRAGVLEVADARRAAAQFAYLIAGEPLDRAILVGTLPAKAAVLACADEGVQTFLARYAPVRRPGTRRRSSSAR
jgi:TetR/AcrR family transcriptional repressor of mexJK operon